MSQELARLVLILLMLTEEFSKLNERILVLLIPRTSSMEECKYYTN